MVYPEIKLLLVILKMSMMMTGNLWMKKFQKRKKHLNVGCILKKKLSLIRLPKKKMFLLLAFTQQNLAIARSLICIGTYLLAQWLVIYVKNTILIAKMLMEVVRQQIVI
jgi:hypothetical protein